MVNVDFDYIKLNTSISHIFKIFGQNGIDFREMYLLSEILKRKSENMELPNVKWVQNELGISFTKLKAMIDTLEKRELIVKITSMKDQRIKYIDITEKGTEFFNKVAQLTFNAFL